MEQLTIYIAGKVTGEGYKHCVAKFATAQRILEAEGYVVINPIEIVPAETEWQQAMSICLNALHTCDGLLLLPDWYKSEGAQIERDQAIINNIKIITMYEFSMGRRFSLICKEKYGILPSSAKIEIIETWKGILI